MVLIEIQHFEKEFPKNIFIEKKKLFWKCSTKKTHLVTCWKIEENVWKNIKKKFFFIGIQRFEKEILEKLFLEKLLKNIYFFSIKEFLNFESLESRYYWFPNGS